MNDIVKRLEIKAGVMEMGEKIAWGSDTALMREAAGRIKTLQRALLFALYHHQGANSQVGQNIRKALHIGQYVKMTDEQINDAKIFGEIEDNPINGPKCDLSKPWEEPNY